MRVKIPLLFLAIILIVLSGSSTLVRAQQNNASEAISAAQGKLVDCFDAAKAAEAAGANISQLTATLNNAGLLLSNAELAYSNGDFKSAQNLAVQSQSALENFVSNANSLQTSATQNRNADFQLNILGSVGGTIAVLVGSAVVWFLLKRKYENSEVGNRESDAV